MENDKPAGKFAEAHKTLSGSENEAWVIKVAGWDLPCHGDAMYVANEINASHDAAVAKAVEAERERLAKIAEGFLKESGDHSKNFWYDKMAKAIRSGNKSSPKAENI